MNREPGFYWVKLQGHWKIKQWVKPVCGDGFFVESNGDFCASECFMEEIDERRIVREEPNDPEVVKELEKMIDKRCMAGEIGVNTSRKMLRVIHPEWREGGHIPATVSYRACEEPSK